MANEATINLSMNIRKVDDTTDLVLLDYRSQPSSFQADVTGTKGPTPGSISVSIAGTDVDFSQLTTPGLCRLMNQDPTNFVEYGIREPGTGTFYPLGEILPGETYIIRLSRNLQEEYIGTGTGTSAPTNFFHLKANVAACNVLVEAFEL